VNLRQLLKVILWMSGALLSFSALALGVRKLGGSFTIFEILAWRTGCGLIIMLAIGAAQPRLFRGFSLRHVRLHALRNGTHLVAQYMWTLAIALLPLATVFALEFTTPAWTTLLAVLFLGERVTAGRLAALVCGLVGVLVIVQPGVATFQPAALLVLAAAFGYGVTYTTTKKLTATDSTFAIILWMNIMQFPITFAASDPLFWLRIGGANLVAALAVGIAGLSSHYCLTKALNSGDASLVIPFDFLRLPIIAVLAWIIYGEPLDPVVLAGGALIFGGVLWNLRSETRRRPKARASAPVEAKPS
jgi:drug/metabolite transporter (DMT)-like permease